MFNISSFAVLFHSEFSHRRTRSGEPPSSQNSLSQSDSLSFRRPNVRYQSTPFYRFFNHKATKETEPPLFSIVSGSLSGGSQTSPLHASSDPRERLKREAGERKQRNERADRMKGEEASSSIEEDIPTAANESLCSESIPSVGDEKGTK